MNRHVLATLIPILLGFTLLSAVPALAALKGSGDVVKASPRQKTLTAAPRETRAIR